MELSLSEMNARGEDDRERQAPASFEALLAVRSSSSSGGGALTRPRSGAASASTLLASVANARFKSFQVQYDVLHKNPILSTIATEIPWKNLFELFQLQFVAVGDVLWRQGGSAHALAFVLCGGFLVRHMASGGSIHAEAMVKPGGSLAAFAVHTSAFIEYAVVAAKFKSIVLTLPAGRYKSIWRQLSLAGKAALDRLVVDAENRLRRALKLSPITTQLSGRGRGRGGSDRSHDPTSSIAITAGSPVSHLLHRRHSSGTRTRLERSASTPTVTGSTVDSVPSAAVAAVVRLDATASWASLQTTQPVEYEVDSSLLILHATSTGPSRHSRVPAAAVINKDTTIRIRGNNCALRASAAARLQATKHTQRRLESIKLPSAVEAFPPPSRRLCGDAPSDAALLLLAEMALEATAVKRTSERLDVVPKVHVGRLLRPLRPLATQELMNDRLDTRRPHTVAEMSQQVVAADRAEPFRGSW